MSTLLRTLIALVLLTTALCAQTWFEISGPAPLVDRTLTVTDSQGQTVATGTFTLVEWSTGWGYDGYAMASLPHYLDENSQEVWTFTAAGWTAQVEMASAVGAWNDAQQNSGTPGLAPAFQPSGSVPVQEFLLPASRQGHVFGLAQPGSGGNVVITPMSLGAILSGTRPDSSTYEYVRGTASFDPAKSFWVIDFTAGQRTPENVIHTDSVNWWDDATPQPLASITFHLDPQYNGYSFTLHYQSPGQSEMVQALTAVPSGVQGAQTMGDGQMVDVTGSVSVTGGVAWGASYWLTLYQYNQTISPTYSLDPAVPYPNPLQWALYSAPPPSPSLQTVEFYVPSGMTGGHVHQPSAERELSGVVTSGFIEDYDANGTPHFFYYDVRTADLDPNEPFWLEINGTEVSQGEQWYYDGWFPLNGPSAPSLLTVSGTLILPVDRQSHALTLTADDGSSMNFDAGLWWNTNQWIMLNDPWVGEWNMNVSTIQQSFELTVQNPSSYTGSLTLTDHTTGESVPLSESGADLSQWWLRANSHAFSISLSRWGHDLRIRQPNGDEYSIFPGSSQGDLTLINTGAWYQSYFYFNGTGNRRPSLDFRLYDATTGEEAAWNQTELSTWVYLPEPDGAYAIQSGVRSIEVIWRLSRSTQDALLGGGFKMERWTSNSEAWETLSVIGASGCRYPETVDWFHFTDTPLAESGISYKYRVSYAYGSDGQASAPTESEPLFIALDSDWDGIPDDREIEWGLNPFAAADAAEDWDGDGLSNHEEYLAGRNPLSRYDGASGFIRIVSGDLQAVAADQIAPEPLVVELRDANEVPLSNAAVRFTVESGDGLFISSGEELAIMEVLTDADGLASVGYRKGSTSPLSRLRASTGTSLDAPAVIFSAGAIAGAVTVSPPGGTFTTAQKVTLTSSTASDRIHYTLDGTEPTDKSHSVASGQWVTVSKIGTLKAKAFASDTVPGATATAAFRITGALAAGDGHHLVLRTDRTVHAWGYNDHGQLGNGSATPGGSAVLTPASVRLADGNPLRDIIAIAAGISHSIALKADGTIYTWGVNGDGQLGLGDYADRLSATEVTGLSDIVAVACGWYHTLALKGDGTVWAWGTGNDGQLGDGLQGYWPDGPWNYTNTPQRVETSPGVPLSGIAKIGAGAWQSYAIDPQGAAWAWGSDWDGELADGQITGAVTRPVQIFLPGSVPVNKFTGGYGFSLLIDGNGKTYGVGYNGSGALGIGQVTGGGGAVMMPTPVCSPTEPTSPLMGLIDVRAGRGHALAIDQSGHLWVWGYNAWRQVVNDSVNHPVPVPIALGAPGTQVVAIASGNNQSVAMTDDGKIWQWGRYYGYSGDWNTTWWLDQAIPASVPGPSNQQDADLDGDGLPDEWERTHFGSLAENGAGDFDNDGMTNLEESEWGLNPADYYNGEEPYPVLYAKARWVNEDIRGYPIFEPYGSSVNLKRRFFKRTATLKRSISNPATRWGEESVSQDINGSRNDSYTKIRDAGPWLDFQDPEHAGEGEPPPPDDALFGALLEFSFYDPNCSIDSPMTARRWAAVYSGKPASEGYYWDVVQSEENMETVQEMIQRAEGLLREHYDWGRVSRHKQMFAPNFNPSYDLPVTLAYRLLWDPPGGDPYSLECAEYKWKWERSPRRPAEKSVQWFEIFNPQSGSGSGVPKLVKREWSGTENESSVFAIDPRSRNGGNYGSYRLAAIDIKEVISDQIAGNEANKLPTAYYRTQPNNPMLMATRSGNDARLKVRVSAPSGSITPPTRVGVRLKGQTEIINSALVVASTPKTPLAFTAVNGSKAYEVVAGFDENTNGTLDTDEVTVVFQKTPKTNEDGSPYKPFVPGKGDPTFQWLDRVIVVTQDDFTAARAATESYGKGLKAFAYPTASDLITGFAKGVVGISGSDFTDLGIDLDANTIPSTDGLGHPLGAKWNGLNKALTHRINIPAGQDLSEDVAVSRGLAQMCERVIIKNSALLKSRALTGIWKTEPLTANDRDIDFSKSDHGMQVHVAIGKCRYEGTVEVTLRSLEPANNGFEIGSVRCTGAVVDLYDFNYSADSIKVFHEEILPKEAARTQAGHATLTFPPYPNAGRVFFTRIEINTGWVPFSRKYNE